jgi:hypothetical protein
LPSSFRDLFELFFSGCMLSGLDKPGLGPVDGGLAGND